jgi:general secretion pathway protein I
MAHSNQHGFSLLEVLIAFSILAFSLTILMRIFSTGVNSAVVSEEYTAAVQIAESVMGRVGVVTGIPLRSTRGNCKDLVRKTPNDDIELGKYYCDIFIEPFNFVTGKFEMKSTAQLYKVEVVVSWGDDDNTNRDVTLSTLKLVNKEQP